MKRQFTEWKYYRCLQYVYLMKNSYLEYIKNSVNKLKDNLTIKYVLYEHIIKGEMQMNN